MLSPVITRHNLISGILSQVVQEEQLVVNFLQTRVDYRGIQNKPQWLQTGAWHVQPPLPPFAKMLCCPCE